MTEQEKHLITTTERKRWTYGRPPSMVAYHKAIVAMNTYAASEVADHVRLAVHVERENHAREIAAKDAEITELKRLVSLKESMVQGGVDLLCASEDKITTLKADNERLRAFVNEVANASTADYGDAYQAITSFKTTAKDLLLSTPPVSQAEKTDRKIGVHAAHCCKEHGCKYGHDDCPVVSGEVLQVRPCEDCKIDGLAESPAIEERDENGLLPCPFCGGKDIDMYQFGNEWTEKRAYEIKCKTFGCCTSKKVGVISQSLEWAKEKCIEKWNQRALQPQGKGDGNG